MFPGCVEVVSQHPFIKHLFAVSQVFTLLDYGVPEDQVLILSS
jgi:hypothetical protein